MSWKTLNTKEVYRSKWMWVTEDEVVTDFWEKLTYGVVHKIPFALIIPWDGKNFTLVGQYRYSIKKYSWEFPQGHFEHSSILETAKTELLEETGLSASSIKLIGSFFLAPGHHSQECKVFLAQDLTEGKQHLESGEKGMKTKKISQAGLEKMIRTGKMADGPTLAAFSIFKNI
jgi:8-oxo-dGTP pyrophosphatase MutT (NUDIX family)